MMPAKTSKTATKKAISPRKPSKVSKPKSASIPKRSSAEQKFVEYWESLYPSSSVSLAL